MELKTKREKKLNQRKNIAYSSYYSTVSFLISLAYLIADIFLDGLWAANFAVVLVIVLIITCNIGIKKLPKGLEANAPQAKEWQERLSKIATKVGYLSYPVLAATLFLAIIANIQPK